MVCVEERADDLAAARFAPLTTTLNVMLWLYSGAFAGIAATSLEGGLSDVALAATLGLMGASLVSVLLAVCESRPDAAVAPEEDASDGGTALPPGPTVTQTTDGYGDDDFEDFTETIKPGARTLGAASKLQDAVLGWLEYKRCDAPPEKTEWTLNEVRASVCVDGDVSSASFEKLGWKVCHQALTRLKAPNRGPTKDLADRLATLLSTS